MIATFVIEISLMAYTIFRYKMNTITRLIAALLGFLALFQLAEYNVCGGLFSLDAESWSRIGYVAITILPPIALHLVTAIAHVKGRWTALVAASYAAAIAWIGFFAAMPSAFDGHKCAGNYAIFQIGRNAGSLYFGYYYLLLIVGIAACIYFAAYAKRRPIKLALLLQLTGYLSFLLPTAITNTVNPETIRGIPSIMCGFAVSFALILAFYILPQLQAAKVIKLRQTQKKRIAHVR